jgi:hypothetical protein
MKTRDAKLKVVMPAMDEPATAPIRTPNVEVMTVRPTEN